MGYMHIENLYRPNAQKILHLFKDVYAMEKIHGTSAWITLSDGKVLLHPGGCKTEQFEELFDKEKLLSSFQELGYPSIRIHGEAYGGKLQAMSATYGKKMQFIVFDVRIGETWLNVENAAQIAAKFGLDFVPYRIVPCTEEALDEQRDLPSEQSKKLGIEGDHEREGIVIRPLVELTYSNGERVIAKHKSETFEERRKTPKASIPPDKLEILKEAEDIAFVWCTPNRLDHVLDALGITEPNMPDLGNVIVAMLSDIAREAEGEIELSKQAKKAIGLATSKWFREKITKAQKENNSLV